MNLTVGDGPGPGPAKNRGPFRRFGCDQRSCRVAAVADLQVDSLDRIDRLSDANRRDRSVEAEELLVKLRRDAAPELARRHHSPLPSRPAVDLFDGTTALPEVAATELTAEHIRSGLLRHGALLVRGVVPEQHLATLTAFLDGKEAKGRASQEQLDEAARDAMRKGLPRLMCSPSAVYDLIEIYKDVGLGETIAEYLGARPLLVGERIRVTRQRGGFGLPWHQDAAFYGGVFGAVNVWLAISPSGRESPGLNVVPRRFDDVCGLREGESLPLPLEYGQRFTPQLIEELVGEHSVGDPEFRPGDALLFDEMTLHRTSQRAWKFPYRDSAVMWFLAPSRVPDGVTPLVF
jgi:hypothetical protein